MAKKEEIGKEIKELKVKIQEDKVVIGVEKVLKGLRDKTLQKIFLASNCPPKISEDIYYYAKLVNVPVVKIEFDNEELGIFCKKNFFIAVLGVN